MSADDIIIVSIVDTSNGLEVTFFIRIMSGVISAQAIVDAVEVNNLSYLLINKNSTNDNLAYFFTTLVLPSHILCIQFSIKSTRYSIDQSSYMTGCFYASSLM